MFGTKRDKGALEWRQHYDCGIWVKALLQEYKDLYTGAGCEVSAGCSQKLHGEIMTLRGRWSEWFQTEVVL
jgi:hypothetical protein